VAQGWLTGVEPRARSGVSLRTRSSPTGSTEDRGSHQGLHGHWRGWPQAGDEEEDTKRYGEVGGGGPGGAPLALVPLLAVAPLPQ
jgi:hypothetical protein